MAKTINPQYLLEAFNCPRCGVLVPQMWFTIAKDGIANTLIKKIENPARDRVRNGIGAHNQQFRIDWDLTISICTHCHQYTIWENQNFIYPYENELPEPHEDMFKDVKGIYQEARDVYKHSPRAAAALLRLAIEIMIPQLEEYNIKKSTINNMIGELVEKDIPEHIQQGLDSIRIYGNEGIHPGEISLNDNQDNVMFLFDLINIMVDELITRRKKIRSFYDKLPKGKIKGIMNRDKVK